MIISMIAAVAENGVIGKDNDLPWYLPDDLKYFKNTTKGHYILMGRKCYESFGKPLPNRTNVVITRNDNYNDDGITVVHSLEEGLELAKQGGETEVFICGGSQIYAPGMDMADKIYLTRVHASVDGDVYFPPMDEGKWKLVSSEKHSKDEKHAYDFTFLVYERA
jgi:dihydrofolate reductase